jgi:hypothetical protein
LLDDLLLGRVDARSAARLLGELEPARELGETFGKVARPDIR